jgi:hypothetical protein
MPARAAERILVVGCDDWPDPTDGSRAASALIDGFRAAVAVSTGQTPVERDFLSLWRICGAGILRAASPHGLLNNQRNPADVPALLVAFVGSATDYPARCVKVAIPRGVPVYLYDPSRHLGLSAPPDNHSAARAAA